MLGTYRWIVFVALGLLMIIFLVGCAQNERREMSVTHEQQAGEVEDSPPGEMVVE